MRIFISYPDKNRSLAIKVAKLCEGNGHESFVAYRDITTTGKHSWLKEIYDQIELREAFILCLDDNSLNSTWQVKEWEHLQVLEDKIVVVVYKGTWNDSYEKLYTHLKAYHHYCLEDKKQSTQALNSLGYPYQQRFDFMQTLILEAGTHLMLKYGLRFLFGKPVPLDKRKNYATEIDVSVQRLITDQIRRRYPDDSILAEELNSEPLSRRSESDFIWTIDPLDGTLNYVSGDERFCCGIGLIHNNKPCLGAIYAPSRMELYTGGEGRPAECRFVNEGGTERMRSESSIYNLDMCHVITHINSEHKNIDLCFKNNFPRKLHYAVRRVWMWGCGLLSLVAISRGSFHLFVQRITYPWDVVPGLAILRSAGGVDSIWPNSLCETWSLNKWKTNPGIVAAGNKKLLRTFIERFQDIKR